MNSSSPGVLLRWFSHFLDPRRISQDTDAIGRTLPLELPVGPPIHQSLVAGRETRQRPDRPLNTDLLMVHGEVFIPEE